MTQIITTGTNPKFLWPGLAAVWGTEYEKHVPEWRDLFEEMQSTQAYEELVQNVGFGLPQVKPETESLVYDTQSQGYTTKFTHVAYALGFLVSQEEIRDNLYLKNGLKRTKDLAFSMQQGHETVCANRVNGAFTTSTGGDAVAWLSASHPTATGNQSNLLTAADLSEASLEDGVIAIMTATDDRGRKINLRAMSLHIHPNNWFEATRILKSVLQNDTAANAINALRASGAIEKGIKVNHYFDDPDAWFIRTSARHANIHFQRDAIEFDDDTAFDTKTMKHSAYERFSVGHADWRGMFGSAGA